MNSTFITSYERDNETELDFAQAKMFNYGHGRFTSPDDFLNDTHTTDPKSWNLYAYVRNNPLIYVDPTGMITDFINKKTGERVHVEDGRDQVIATSDSDFTGFQNLFKTNKKNYFTALAFAEMSKNNLRMTVAQFNDLSSILYAETSPANATWQEAAAMHGVLRNRATADDSSVLEEANDTSQVFGAGTKEKQLINSKFASEAKKREIYKGIAQSISSGHDYSNGGYYWHGTDFKGPTRGSKAHERFYKTGFYFTDKSHNLWNMKDYAPPGAKHYKFKSTAAYGETTFMRLTDKWMKANKARRWNGQ